MNNFITFVIPAYNVADYLEECLESVLHQTVDGWKIILVDDGSTDNKTSEICRRYADAHPKKIKAVFQKNRGLGGARNTGLNQVDTKYVMFFDSDDILDLNFVYNLKKREEKYKCDQIDMIFTLPVIYDNRDKKYYDWYDKQKFIDIFGHEAYRVPVVTKELFSLEVNACRKVYRTNFLRELNFQFDEHLKYEDFYPHYYLLYNAKSCLGFDITSFYYRINRPNQITQLRNSSRLDVVKIISKTFDFAITNEIDPPLVNIIFDNSINFSIWCINNSAQEVREKLIEQLSRLYNVLPKELVNEYLNYTKSRKYKYFLKIIRSSLLSKLMYDYLLIELVKEKLAKRKG